MVGPEVTVQAWELSPVPSTDIKTRSEFKLLQEHSSPFAELLGTGMLQVLPKLTCTLSLYGTMGTSPKAKTEAKQGLSNLLCQTPWPWLTLPSLPEDLQPLSPEEAAAGRC